MTNLNREVGEIGRDVKNLVETAKEIKELLENHDRRISRLEHDKSWFKGVAWSVSMIGGIIGSIITYVAKALAN
jgi:hypothetical protein